MSPENLKDTIEYRLELMLQEQFKLYKLRLLIARPQEDLIQSCDYGHMLNSRGTR